MSKPIISIRYEKNDESGEPTTVESTCEINTIEEAREMAHAMVDEIFNKGDASKCNHLLITTQDNDYWTALEDDWICQSGLFDCRKLTLAQQRMVERFINHVENRDA
jgi:hypothetical protein